MCNSKEKLFEDQCNHGNDAYFGRYNYCNLDGDLYFYKNLDRDVWYYCHRYGVDGDYRSGSIVHLVYPCGFSDGFTEKQKVEILQDDARLFQTFCKWRGLDEKVLK